jgi:hypothetical protein
MGYRIGYLSRTEREYLKSEVSRRKLERVGGRCCKGCGEPHHFYTDGCTVCNRRRSFRAATQ